LQLQLRVSDVPKEKTEALAPGSLHRFTFVFPVPADSGMSGIALPWRELEVETVELALDTPSESAQSPDMTNREAGSNVTVMVEGVVGIAESMGTSLLHRYA